MAFPAAFTGPPSNNGPSLWISPSTISGFGVSTLFSDWGLTLAFSNFSFASISQFPTADLTKSLNWSVSGSLIETCFWRSVSHYSDGCKTSIVFVMLMTLPPHSGQSLLRGKENPTSATNSISSKIKGWKIPLSWAWGTWRGTVMMFSWCLEFPFGKKISIFGPWAKQLSCLVFISGKPDYQQSSLLHHPIPKSCFYVREEKESQRWHKLQWILENFQWDLNCWVSELGHIW